MKTNWQTTLGAMTGVAALVLSLIGLVMNMNQVSGGDKQRIENRLTLLEVNAIGASKQIDRQDRQIENNRAALENFNVRLDRLERSK